MISLNELAADILRRLTADAESLAVESRLLGNGAEVVDVGVSVPGSLEAGRLFAEVCMAGLGRLAFCQLDVGDLVLPGVAVEVGRPVLACLAAQYAGWAVSVPRSDASGKKYFAMGSGPARALYRGEALFKDVDYEDPGSVAVLALETRELPSSDVAEWVAARCGVPPDAVHLLVAPTASLAGSVQIAARIVETGLHKMHEIGFDLGTVRSGFGTCPLAPVAPDDLTAIGRTNDAVLYGGRAWYTVETADDLVEDVIGDLASAASRDYGTTFAELFGRYDHDFYKIDPLLFSPAEVWITNATSGRTFRSGGVDPEVLRRSFFA